MREIMRTRWAAIGAAVAVSLGAGGVSLTQAALTSGEKPVYVALDAPCRLVDTRPTSLVGPKNTPIAAGDAEAYEIQVTGANGQCIGGLAIPADATAVALNVTAIAPVATTTGRSYFTVYPADATRPNTSNLNFLNGSPPVPNKVDVGLSATGKIKIYNNEGTAHAAVDVFGYYVDHFHDDRYYTEAEVDAATADLVVSDDGKSAYAWACEEAATIGVAYNATAVCGYSFNPSGSAITATRTAVGAYTVSFPGLAMSQGHVQVSAYGPNSIMCKIVSWSGSSVNVTCYDAGGGLANSRFTVLALD